MNTADRVERASATQRDPRWRQVLDRDPGADGQFWYSVRTTGVYCRPSCGARHALPENVAFHASQEEARAAGFRPCRRCRPDQTGRGAGHAERITAACRTIETAEAMPTLDALAAVAGLSPSHFHRLFKAATGLTPRAYAQACRARRLRHGLTAEDSVTAAIFAAGYGSSSRFYEESDRVLGMSPRAFRQGGADQAIRFAIGQCALGAALVACSDRGICAISLGDDPDALARELQDRFPRAALSVGDPDFERLVARVLALVEHPALALELPLDVRGTAFQQRVWQALRAIPSGERVSYADLAVRIGAPKAVRAVAGACAANTLAVAIPCHRVVRTDGSLSGYRWGVERKRALLERESSS